jgi:hypothetical protein
LLRTAEPEKIAAEASRLQAKVEADLAEEAKIRERRVAAERELDLLQSIFRFLTDASGYAAQTGSLRKGTDASAVRDVDAAILFPSGERAAVEVKAKAKPVPKREPILNIMREYERLNPNLVNAWTAPAMREALEERGFEATTNNVRVTMKRMVEAGQLALDEDGEFVLPD